MRCISLLVFLLPAVTCFDLAPNSNVVIHVDPHLPTAKGNCSQHLKTTLTTEVLGWFNEGMSNFQGKEYHQNMTFKMTASQEMHHRQLVQQDERNSNGRELCSKTTCYDCCVPACYIYCACYLCGGSRHLRHEVQRKELASKTDVADLNAELSTFVKYSVRSWLQSNDPERCMGNPYKLTATVSIAPN
jgi:hypothetical protein